MSRGRLTQLYWNFHEYFNYVCRQFQISLMVINTQIFLILISGIKCVLLFREIEMRPPYFGVKMLLFEAAWSWRTLAIAHTPTHTSHLWLLHLCVYKYIIIIIIRPVTTERTILANTPDIVMSQWRVFLKNVTILYDDVLVKAETEKRRTYLDVAHAITACNLHGNNPN